MLDLFITKIKLLDPDFIVCHGLTNGIFEVLMSRINFNKVSHWSRLGRFKRNIPPKAGKFDFGGGFFLPRQVTVGRLICDTFFSSQELIRETNYNLTELART